MSFQNKRLVSCLIIVSVLFFGQQALSQSAIPDDKCAIITGATKDPAVALKAVEKFKDYVPVVIESSNGYLAPSLGIYYKDGAKELVEDFKKDKIIPDDSYCGNADRFVSVLYPNQNFTALTTNPPSLIAQYSYVGKWSADPNDCSITEYETDSIYFDEYSVTFATKSCDVKDQQVSPVNSLGLIIEMSCFEEGEQYDGVLSLILQAEDKILIRDTDLEYTKCAQLDESPIVATENRLAELEEQKVPDSDEIVINKNGDAVLLKTDGTWEVMDTSSEDGKLVFSIRSATNYHNSYPRKNDMDEFSHYSNIVGCFYNIEVKNNTNFKIKVDKFKIESNNKKLFDDRMTRNELIQFGKVLNPGEVFIGKGQYKEGGPKQWVDKTKELATDEQIETWTNKYGCDAQNGSIFITTADMGKDVAFSETSGISEEAKNNFIVGSQSGVYPIIKETNLR